MSGRTQRKRLPVEERRDLVLDVAIAEFAEHGLSGATTHAIAERAGISQPLIFHLFKDKKALFLAAARRSFDQIEATFREAAATADTTEAKLEAMATLYRQRHAGPQRGLAQFHLYAACSDPDVRAAAREHHRRLFAVVQELSGATIDEVRMFFAFGMLIAFAEAVDAPDLAGEALLTGRPLGSDAA